MFLSEGIVEDAKKAEDKEDKKTKKTDKKTKKADKKTERRQL
jgi:hypothetical protein